MKALSTCTAVLLAAGTALADYKLVDLGPALSDCRTTIDDAGTISVQRALGDSVALTVALNGTITVASIAAPSGQGLNSNSITGRGAVGSIAGRASLVALPGTNTLAGSLDLLREGFFPVGNSQTRSVANDINASATVVGTYWTPGQPDQQAFQSSLLQSEVFRRGNIVRSTLRVTTSLAQPLGNPSNSEGWAIDSAGTIVGSLVRTGTHRVGFMLDSQGVIDIDPAGAQFTNALGSDGSGTVVGYTWSLLPVLGSAGFRWRDDNGNRTADNSEISLLSDVQLWAINASGVAVGTELSFFRPSAGAVISFNGASYVLLQTLVPGAPDWTLDVARDINNADNIVGCGSHNGDYRAFLLRPVPFD